MIPRANRCIFVINELPDLQARIQVSLFNILQEGDIQIRGFQLRMPLDIQFIFTANPEDYTNRGSIVTPLKDRIGSQIFTHYPKTVALAKKITAQEANISAEDLQQISIPEIAKDLLEQVSFEARNSEYVDAKSGVSARLSISALENLMAAANLRLIETDAEHTRIRLTDFMSIIPAITGKIELVYEGEQEGAAEVAQLLIDEAVNTKFESIFPPISKLEKEGVPTPYTDIISWFNENTFLEIGNYSSDTTYLKSLNSVSPLKDIVGKYCPNIEANEVYFYMEIVLWALAINDKLDRTETENAFTFEANLLSKHFYGSN
jgi:magnesium chelatase subunit I